MGLSVFRDQIKDVCVSERFSIIDDEATDVSNKEQLALCIKWVDSDFSIHEDPVELIHVLITIAITLEEAIKDCLTRFSLPLVQCRGPGQCIFVHSQ